MRSWNTAAWSRRYRDTLVRYGALASGETVILGVSGGPDSLCLLHVMRRLAPTLGIKLHVGHLDHGIRGDEAEEDARYVREICRDWETPCTLERADVPALAAAKGLAIEEEARRARYAFLADLARRLGSGAVAVAHHADDQVETVLMHLLRGSGMAGLRGMRPASWVDEMRLVEGAARPPRVRLLRPLLYVSRAEIEAYCLAHEIKPRYDRSNLDQTYYRNRLRHELIPILETYNPNIRAVLQRMAEVIAADYELLREQIERAWARVVVLDRSGDEDQERYIVYDLDLLRDLPLALQRSLVREGIHRLRRTLRNINWVHVDSALDVLKAGRTGAVATLPQGLALTLGYHDATMADMEQVVLGASRPRLWAEPLAVPIGGVVALPQRGDSSPPHEAWLLETAVYPRDAIPSAPDDNQDVYTAYLDADCLREPLALRTRREGDAFYPLGLGHSQKLRDFMINNKIPRQERATAPLMICGADIVWVVGWRIDARYAVAEQTTRVLVVRVRRATQPAAGST